MQSIKDSKRKLQQFQSLSLKAKITLSLSRIRAWHNYYNGNTYISFSGGKDSTVLLHLVHSLYPNTPVVFIDTGLEYPEVRDFALSKDPIVLKPRYSFKQVLDKYGYPVISKDVSQKIHDIRNTKSSKLKNLRLYGDPPHHPYRGKLPNKWKFLLNSSFKISHKCCNIMKKNPAAKYEYNTNRRPYIGTMVQDSNVRELSYLRRGCNSFDTYRPISTPLAFWFDQDIWGYIKDHNLSYSSIYDKGYTNTGCMFCMFGVHREDSPNRFQRMKQLHPKLHDYCINRLNCKQVLNFIGVEYE